MHVFFFLMQPKTWEPREIPETDVRFWQIIFGKECNGSDPFGSQYSSFNGPKSVNSDKQSLVVDCQWFGPIMRTFLGLKLGCGN